MLEMMLLTFSGELWEVTRDQSNPLKANSVRHNGHLSLKVICSVELVLTPFWVCEILIVLNILPVAKSVPMFYVLAIANNLFAIIFSVSQKESNWSKKGEKTIFSWQYIMIRPGPAVCWLRLFDKIIRQLRGTLGKAHLLILVTVPGPHFVTSWCIVQ